MSEKFDWSRYHEQHRTIELGKRSVRIATSHPEHEGDYNGETVLLVPGLTSGTAIFGPFAHRLNQIGYQTVAMSHDKVDQDCKEDVMEIAEQIITGEIGDYETTNLSIAAHSLGAILAVKGLAGRPDIEEYVHNLTLAAPAGYGGVQFLRGATESVLFELAHRPSTEELRNAVFDALRYSIAANIQLRGRIEEARHTDIIPETKELLARSLPILALVYPNDRLIRREPLIAGLEDAGIPVIRVISEPKSSGHNAHLYYPDQVVAEAMQGLYELGQRGERA